MTRCDHCSVRLDEADAIHNRRGTFCTTDCDERHRRDAWSLADPPDDPAAAPTSEPWLIQPEDVRPCHP